MPTRINTRKKLLQTMLVGYVVVVVIHKLVEHYHPPEEFWLSWSFLLALIYGISVMIYALSLRCANCNVRQVFRGMPLFDLRWPDETCHACGASASEVTSTDPTN
jgi:hypothetical protein